MNKIKNLILIPVFNDWRSLNKLINKLEINLKRKEKKVDIYVINDSSTEKLFLLNKNLVCIKKIKVLSLSKRVGSQIAIAAGLNYLKRIKNEFIITVMDSDGEDDPSKVSEMIDLAIKNQNDVITSNRKNRKESKIIIFLYYLHLLLTFFFTFKWISFGNFTSFHKKNLAKLFSDKSSILAYPSAVLKNCNIKKTFAKRKKRYFDKSKLGLLSLIEHSLRLNAVFQTKIFMISLIYIIITHLLMSDLISKIVIPSIIMFNLMILLIKIKFYKKKIPSIK